MTQSIEDVCYDGDRRNKGLDEVRKTKNRRRGGRRFFVELCVRKGSGLLFLFVQNVFADDWVVLFEFEATWIVAAILARDVHVTTLCAHHANDDACAFL